MADSTPRVVTGAIPGVTGGETITEPWGDQVAQAINEHTHGGAAGSAGETPVAHGALTGVTPDQHHAAVHGAEHLPGGTDPLPASSGVAIQYVIDGGAAVIAAGIKADLLIPFACTITQWTLLADGNGTITVNVWRDTYAGFPPEAAGLLGSPAIAASASKAQAAVAWAIVAGDVLRVNVAAATGIKRVTLALTATRS